MIKIKERKFQEGDGNIPWSGCHCRAADWSAEFCQRSAEKTHLIEEIHSWK